VPERCVIVVDEALPAGLAANAAAVVALTLGAREPALAGPDLVDADDGVHPGLIPMGLPVLTAPQDDLRRLRERAAHNGVGVIDMPTCGQQTNDYHEVREAVSRPRGVRRPPRRRPPDRQPAAAALRRSSSSRQPPM
jgi:hypothetical protein